ncbi:hypothetical protein H9L39_17327 [Fusarium oxysporum f. sp. albedinis]|nr:hypothetical protein H9L39_17327 [Fusarium oxysporum f. sp. albedinis]
MSSSIAIPAGPSATPLVTRALALLPMIVCAGIPDFVPGSFLSKQECTVINIGEPNSPPRLICYVSSSQGFAWNPEIFLPSCIDCDYVPLENR